MPYTHNAPFRYDVVGSFLRPDVLHQARHDFADDPRTDEETHSVANAFPVHE